MPQTLHHGIAALHRGVVRLQYGIVSLLWHCKRAKKHLSRYFKLALSVVEWGS